MSSHGEAGEATAVRPRRLRVPQWVLEILLVGALYGIYELARGVHQGTEQTANRVGAALLRWEHAVYLDPEKWLTDHLDRLTWLAVPASYFYATAHYIVTPAVLVWMFLRHRREYLWGRTWLACSTMLSLIIFYLCPTTPPRLLPNHSFPDVLKDVSRFGWWSSEGSAPRGLGHLTNQLAAMPSMHVGWALWCAVMVYRNARHAWVRWLGVAYPIVTTAVVISTGNHYLLDTVAGVLTMGAGAVATVAIYALGRRLRTHTTAAEALPTGAPPTGAAAAGDGQLPVAGAQNSLHTTSG